MRPRTYRRLLALALAFAAVAGCGKTATKTVSVSGTVYLDGKPTEGIEVHFVAKDHSGYAVTAADGTYQLVQGAALGENKLYFRRVETSSSKFKVDPEHGMDMNMIVTLAEADAMNKAVVTGRAVNFRVPGERIPSKYSDPEKSNITFNVPEGGTTTADFRLTSK